MHLGKPESLRLCFRSARAYRRIECIRRLRGSDGWLRCGHPRESRPGSRARSLPGSALRRPPQTPSCFGLSLPVCGILGPNAGRINIRQNDRRGHSCERCCQDKLPSAPKDDLTSVPHDLPYAALKFEPLLQTPLPNCQSETEFI
jgi:hypothetical protein